MRILALTTLFLALAVSALGQTKSPAEKSPADDQYHHVAHKQVWLYETVTLSGEAHNFELLPQQTLSARKVTAHSVQLGWMLPVEPVPANVAVNVYRCTGAAAACPTAGTGFTKIAPGVAGITYTDTSVAAATTYTYQITATCATNCGTAALPITGESAPSNQIVATTPTAPSAPTNLQCAATTTTVNCTWTAPTGTPAPTGYNVYRSTASGTFTTPYATLGNVTTYTDTAMPTDGTARYFVVTALNGANESLMSNQVQIALLPQPSAPGAPILSIGTVQ